MGLKRLDYIIDTVYPASNTQDIPLGISYSNILSGMFGYSDTLACTGFNLLSLKASRP